MQLALATIRSLPQIQERFSTGEGFGWHEHDRDLFVGTERFFRPGYAVDLVPTWLPAMDGVVETLTHGAVVADVGAGHGASTILMAQAFPNSEFIGSDYHEASMVVARRRAKPPVSAARVSFETHDATELPAAAYDLVTMFDCLHDMGDPTAAARAVRRSLRPGGVFLLVEPAAGDRLGGQPQSPRPALLRRLHDDLHPGITGPTRKCRTRTTGRTGGAHPSAQRSGLHRRVGGPPQPSQPRLPGPFLTPTSITPQPKETAMTTSAPDLNTQQPADRKP